MKKSLTVAAALIAALVGSGAAVAAQAPGASAPGKDGYCADKGTCGGMDGCCCDHKGMDAEMAAKMAEMDKRMDELAAKMNAASGGAKADAMAAVLNEMLARQKAMHERMHARHEGMRGGMAGKGGCCCDHMGMNPEMAAKMAEMHKRMDELGAKMNAAKGGEKVDAMAAVLNEMLAHQRAMRERMQARHEGACGGAPSGGEKTEGMSEGLLGEQEHSP